MPIGDWHSGLASANGIVYNKVTNLIRSKYDEDTD